jgi:bifunctional N-acetylglucosamine-1-phosphate-uridyltransferase/glucosamine-1-phosphate-acetyltransferase GlmU-like protein
MIDRLLALYGELVSRIVVVVSPSAFDAVQAHMSARSDVALAVQPQPTGMLDAILIGTRALREADVDSVWITWCDQIGVDPHTVQRLSTVTTRRPDAAIVFPTALRADPYIHFMRDSSGRITDVLQRREGNVMPHEGESDIGLFALSREAWRTLLREYETAGETGHGTGERNFLPFIPWVARRAVVLTFPCEDPMEAIGVNTPDELEQVAAFLAARRG